MRHESATSARDVTDDATAGHPAVASSAAGAQRWSVMAWLSVSLPQTVCVQPEITASATAVPCLKDLPPDVAKTLTRSCCFDPLQPVVVDPVPWATPEQIGRAHV